MRTYFPACPKELRVLLESFIWDEPMPCVVSTRRERQVQEVDSVFDQAVCLHRSLHSRSRAIVIPKAITEMIFKEKLHEIPVDLVNLAYDEKMPAGTKYSCNKYTHGC